VLSRKAKHYKIAEGDWDLAIVYKIGRESLLVKGHLSSSLNELRQ